MYPSVHLPPPLPPASFYTLLALSRGNLHGYAIKAAITNDSLGSIKAGDGYLYPLLSKLCSEKLIAKTSSQGAPTEAATPAPAAAPAPARRRLTRYCLTDLGHIRLEEELKRLQYAVKIGDAGGYFGNRLPTDIQRLLAEAD